MGLFKKKKSSVPEIIEKEVRKDEVGRDVHVFDGPDGEVEVTRISAASRLPTGEEWCPRCHIPCVHHDEDKYYECPDCGWTTEDWEIEQWGGHPTEESSYDDPTYN
jgi:hypothetical protein